ncbi:hypothetical protein BQ8482_400020 [Mesorhizobium delmotii]|uniref:Uncharacterized protein n=1 Tax=Mesorhizobium delmotii TaxID=1631247 RepID=A0A2P9AT12_9HYPH|nr:hypothetical protein BQ8482_400020 [Mesorhizobium delmotii]
MHGVLTAHDAPISTLLNGAQGGFFARPHKLAFVEVDADDADISPTVCANSKLTTSPA